MGLGNFFNELELTSQVEHETCDDSECDECNPVIEDDVICQRCGEHSEMREETGTECCGAGSRF